MSRDEIYTEINLLLNGTDGRWIKEEPAGAEIEEDLTKLCDCGSGWSKVRQSVALASDD